MAGVNLGHQERVSLLNGGFNRPNVRFTTRPLSRGAKRETNGLVARKSPGDVRARGAAGPSWAKHPIKILSDDGRAQMIGRIFTGSISLCGESERFVTAVDGSTRAIGRVSWCSSECAPRFQRALFLWSARRTPRGPFLVKTRADFSMNVSPEPGEPTRS
jgi:hypothetical protein